MKKLIVILVMLAVAGMAWAGVSTTMTCDGCGKEIAKSPCCQQYHIRVSYEPTPWEDCNVTLSVYVPPPPDDMIFCGPACLKAHYCKDEEEGPLPGSVIIPEEIGTDFITILPYDENPCRGILDQ